MSKQENNLISCIKKDYSQQIINLENINTDILEKHTNFDWKKYISFYDDLNSLKTQKEALDHWLCHGKNENRTYFTKICETENEINLLKNALKKKISETNNDSHYNIDIFDWEYYLNYYVDLKDSNIKTKIEAFDHWINNGIKENRIFFKLTYKFFDWEKYIFTYEDLHNFKTKEEAVMHWETYGIKEEREYFNLEKPIVEKPIIEKPIIEKPIIEKPIIEKPKVEKPKVEKPIVEKPPITYETFEWKNYVSNYEDLAYLDSKQKAWDHWEKYGKNEKRIVEYNIKQKEIENYKLLKQQSKNTSINIKNDVDLKFKKLYDNYGTHYYGWKMVVNQFINNFCDLLNENENIKIKLNKKTFFDEWIEKLLLWGNKIEKEKTVEMIHEKDYNIITFIHNPPYTKWYETKNIKLIQKDVIIADDNLLNKNLFKQLYMNKLHTRITYLYTLSNSHKEYICKTYPFFKNKIMSVYHPIDLNVEKDKLFDYQKFLIKKRFVHIGWWLRNFKTFINFKQPSNFSKMIIVKDDFKQSWEHFVQNYDISNIIIKENLSNSQYEDIFKSNCIFIDLEDCVANNTILECMKFNTPIITRRHPSIEEYLGKDYPLFFDNENELSMLSKDETKLEYLILKAHNYLTNMDKLHISLETFNNKLLYDVSKLELFDKTNKLTLCCLLDNNVNATKIEDFIDNFNNQTNIELVVLKMFVYKDVYENPDIFNDSLIEKINSYVESVGISLIIIEKTQNYFNNCLKNIKTEYFSILNINDKISKDYSIKHINFLNKNVNCDITFSSYISVNNTTKKSENIIFKQNQMFFSSNDYIEKNIYKYGIVWRTELFNLINILETDKIKNIINKCLQNNFNISNISENPNIIVKVIN
jgi:hypothetical protein